MAFPKTFHVSPFMPMDAIRLALHRAGRDLRVHMDVLRDGALRVRCHAGAAAPALNGASLAPRALRYPADDRQVVAAIHWQALRLWLKGNPVHDHPDTGRRRQLHERCIVTERRHTSAPTLDGIRSLLRSRLLGAAMPAAGTAAVVAGRRLRQRRARRAPTGPARAHRRSTTRRFYRAVAANGSVGAGEAYMDGLWQCDDLVGTGAHAGAQPRPARRHGDAAGPPGRHGAARLARLRRNTRDGSRRNIAAHYDLGNEFFALFLSADLMYSSALWARRTDTLEAASTRKLRADLPQAGAATRATT